MTAAKTKKQVFVSCNVPEDASLEQPIISRIITELSEHVECF
jgi:hypothetical protein